MGVPYDTALDDRFKETVELLTVLPEEDEELPGDDVVSGPVPQPLSTVSKRKHRINMTDGRRSLREEISLIIFLLFFIDNLHCVQHNQSIVHARKMHIDFLCVILRCFFVAKTGPNINKFLYFM